MLGTKRVAAIGVSLRIERVFTVMEQNQKDDKQVKTNALFFWVSFLFMSLVMNITNIFFNVLIASLSQWDTSVRPHIGWVDGDIMPIVVRHYNAAKEYSKYFTWSKKLEQNKVEISDQLVKIIIFGLLITIVNLVIVF